MSKPTHYVEYKKRTIKSVTDHYVTDHNISHYIFWLIICIESLICYGIYILPIFRIKRLYPVMWKTELFFDEDNNGDVSDSEYKPI